jgi:hypothetical protein
MKARTAFVAVVAAIFSLSAPVSELQAQDGWFFDAEAGVVVPLGSMADALKAGPTFGVAAGQQFENVGVGLSFDIDLLSGAELDDGTKPDTKFYRYHIFGEYGFIDPRVSKNQVNLVISTGGTTLSADGPQSFSSTFFSFEAGIHAGTGKVFFEALWSALFAASDKTSPVYRQGFGTVSSLVFKGGIRL